MDRSQGLAGGHERGGLVACRAGGILPQSDDRQEADDPDHDDDGLRNATGDVAESDPLVLSLDDRVSMTAVPMTAIARTISKNAPRSTCVSSVDSTT